MEISHSKRILIISLERDKHLLSDALNELTGSYPQPNTGTSSLAGASHQISLDTPYYKADVPIWIDIIASPSEWATSFTSAEAKEVLDVLGGILVVFSVSSDSSTTFSKPNLDATLEPSVLELFQEVGRVIDALGGYIWNGVSLAVGVGGSHDEADALVDDCESVGLEFIHFTRKRGEKNEFGEKTGVERALEALQANDWNLATLDSEDDKEFGDFTESNDKEELRNGNPGSLDDGFDPEDIGFGFDKADFEGLKKAIWSIEQDEEETELDDTEIEKLGTMMTKLQAVRDMSAGLPNDQKKKMAKKSRK